MLRYDVRNAPFLICCLLAFGVRFLYLAELSEHSVLFTYLSLDEQEVALVAEGLLSGQGFGPGPLFKAPFYPVLMAGVQWLFGGSWFWGLRFIQHLAGVGLVALAMDTAGRLSACFRVRPLVVQWVCGLGFALYAPMIRLESRLVLDVWVVVWQSAMVWACIRSLQYASVRKSMRWTLLAGGFGALAWWTRPTLTPLLPVLALLLAVLSPRLSPGRLSTGLVRALGFLLLPALAIGALGLRNAQAGEVMWMPWQGGYNLYQANRPGAHGRYLEQSGFSDAASGNPTRTLMITGYQQAVARGEIPGSAESELRYQEVSRYWMGKTVEAVVQDPLGWIQRMAMKVLWLVNQREIFNFEDYEVHRALSGILRRLPLGFGVFWPLALASIPFAWKEKGANRNGLIFLWSYGVGMAGAIALVYVSGRLRMPLVFPAGVLGSLALVRIGSGGWPSRNMTGMAIVLFMAGVGMSWGDWGAVRSEQVAHHDWLRMSNAAWHQQQPALALTYARRAEVLVPDYPRIPLMKAQAFYDLGEVDEAERSYREAMVLQPDDPVPAFNLGVLTFMDRRDPLKARAFFEQVLQRQPRSVSANAYLAMCLVQARALEDARARMEDIPPAAVEQSLPARVAWISVLQAEGRIDQASAAYRQWIEPLPQPAREEAERLLAAAGAGS